MVDPLFSKLHFYPCLFLSLSYIRHIAIFRKGNIPSDKLRSCFYCLSVRNIEYTFDEKEKKKKHWEKV